MSPSRKGSQRSSHAKRAGKDLESVTSEFVCVSLPLPLLLRKVFCSIFFFFSGQKDKVPLIQGVASSPPYWHFFSTETHLPPPTKFHRIKVLFSTTCKCTWQRHWPAKLLLPELSSGCYKTGNAQAMGLGGLGLNLQIPGLVLPCGQSLLGGQQGGGCDWNCSPWNHLAYQSQSPVKSKDQKFLQTRVQKLLASD